MCHILTSTRDGIHQFFALGASHEERNRRANRQLSPRFAALWPLQHEEFRPSDGRHPPSAHWLALAIESCVAPKHSAGGKDARMKIYPEVEQGQNSRVLHSPLEEHIPSYWLRLGAWRVLALPAKWHESRSVPREAARWDTLQGLLHHAPRVLTMSSTRFVSSFLQAPFSASAAV